MAGVPCDLPSPKVTGGLKAAVQIGHESGKQCRICLEDEENLKNPFIAPCKCIGSVRFIHMDCFRAWLCNKKLEQYDTGVLSLFWEELKCDICKSDLNLTEITMGDSRTLHYLLGIKAPSGKKYIIIESDTEC